MPYYLNQFTLTASVVVGATGIASVTFRGPNPVGSYYDVDGIALANNGVLLPTAKLYHGLVGANLIATNLDGATGTFERTGDSDRILNGEQWSIEWTAASVGSTCQATLRGMEFRP